MDLEREVVKAYLKRAGVTDLTLEQQRKLQDVYRGIPRYWDDKDNFVRKLHLEISRAFNNKPTYNNLVSALMYLRDSYRLIKPEEASLLFFTIGLTEEKVGFKTGEGNLHRFQDLLVDNSDFGLPRNRKIFQLRKVA